MNNGMIEAMTGLKKGTHRGKRSRGKGPKTCEEHAAAIPKQMAAGDHGGAKLSALALAKALHKRQKEASSTTSSTLTPDAKALI